MPTSGRTGGRRCCHVWPEGEGQGLRQCFSASGGQDYGLLPPMVAVTTTVILQGPYPVAPSGPTGPDGRAHLSIRHTMQGLLWDPTPRTSS